MHAPPVVHTTEDHYLVGKFIWHDLLTRDAVEARRFYSGLFGWQFRTEESREGQKDYIINRGRIIGTIRRDIDNVRGANPAIWLSSLSVADIDEAMATVEKQGGEIFAGPGYLTDRGRFVIVSDSQGAYLMLQRSSGGDPVDIQPRSGDWLWMELWTRDIHKAAAFYKALVNYSFDDRKQSTDEGYYRFRHKDRVRAGMIRLPVEEVKPNWLPYVKVMDVYQAASKVRQLGGRVIIEPDPDVGQGRIAVIADPEGGVLAIQALSQ